MRAGAWWSAAALALLALASALRSPQVKNLNESGLCEDKERLKVEGATRVSRRLPPPTISEDKLDSPDTEDLQSTFRPRSSRRREDTSPREVVRTRSRSRPVAVTTPVSESQTSVRNEGFDSRRTYSRTRNRPAESQIKKDITSSSDNVVRSRIRLSSRRIASTTQAPLEVSSPTIDESKIEVVNLNLDELSKVTTKDYDNLSTQFRRRSSISPTTETVTRRSRGRIDTRPNTGIEDLAVAGTTNSFYREPTTARISADLRNSRKLRYRTRLSETDTNLTGEGIIANEVTQSSQNKEIIPSQPEIQTVAPIVVAEIAVQPSTGAIPEQTTTNKAIKVVRRPLLRGKVNFRPAVSLTKMNKPTEEINEDDNYPDSFKALIQAKNASTPTTSPASESLSVKASQKVYKTYISSAQSTNTGTATNKYTRLRSKINAEEETKKDKGKVEDKPSDNTSVREQPNSRTPEYRPRGIYTSRNRKSSSFSTSTTATNVPSSISTERSLYKFNRKFKVTTSTMSPSSESTPKNKRFETSNLLKKSLVRPSYYSRRNSHKNITSTEVPATEQDVKILSNDSITVPSRTTLPKTSYYSRLKNRKPDLFSTTIETITESSTEKISAENKNENILDMPLVFSLLKDSNDGDSTKPEAQQPKKMFIIAVTSKESDENNTENDVSVKREESENKLFVNNDSTPKYHATYKDKFLDNNPDAKEQVTQASTPVIRNIQTRKYGRKWTKPKEIDEEVATITAKPRERNLRKFSDSSSKTTERSTNGIPPEPEKHKSRYSSKFRTSFNDKPFYKPTVPTITSSTAWLKFFVTDHQLAKYVEESNWFEEEDLVVTTEMSRQNSTPSSLIHESSIELVEGEEFQIGPDMNAISFTMPRSTLSSADLRLSESLVKPSQILNIEASQHSPSVTISIFDALAEILTSTPRTTRVSSTTEVTQKQTTNNDIKRTLNGVSNNINVNNVKGLASQNTFTTTNTDVNIITNSVQITEQTNPNVNNRLSVGESATPSLNTEGRTPVNTQTLPAPIPTTPISVRRPFAIRVLYSETESPTDKLSTATISTPIQLSTDNPTTVFNTVPDLLLTNNNLVSSELTSMLSNNIKNIIQNMDENTRSKLTVDMAKLLKSLVPRALDRLTTVNDNVDFGPNTTPYSLEEIRDTENVEVTDVGTNDSLQTVDVLNAVNSTTVDIPAGDTGNHILTVNIPYPPSEVVGSTLFVSKSQTTADNLPLITSLNDEQYSSLGTPNSTPGSDTTPSSISLDTKTLNDTDNVNMPIPFLTNFQITEFTASDLDNNLPTTQIETLPLTTRAVTPPSNKNDIDIQDSNQVSPIQLWVLSKKARVLKMIEDLIREHNTELATTPPLTEMLNQENNIPLSNRLTEIINTMSSSTESPEFSNGGNSTSSLTTVSLIPSSTQTNQPDKIASDSDAGRTFTATESTVASNDLTSTTSQIASDIQSRLGSAGTTDTESFTDSADLNGITTPITTTLEVSNRAQDVLSTTVINEETTRTTQKSTETTTMSVETETTQTDVDTTTAADVDMTTQIDVENINNTSNTNATEQNIVSVSNPLSIGTTTIPKKDYVIFGILPNNTVVRKDPNDDILETLTEASPYIVYGILPNNTIIRRFPNGTRVPRVMQKIDVLPISPWSLRNPYSPIHNNPAIVRPRSNPIRVSTNIVTSTDTNNGTETLTNDTVNNLQTMIPSTALNIKDSSSLGVTTATNRLPAKKNTASHVLSLRTPTMLPSVDEILLNSISSAAKEDMVISSMTSSTLEPRILTLDIDPETQQIRTEKPIDGNGGAVFKFIPIDEVNVAQQDTNVLKLASTKAPFTSITGTPDIFTRTATVTEINTQTPQIQTQKETFDDATTTVQITAGTSAEINPVTAFTNSPIATTESETSLPIATVPPTTTLIMTTLALTTTTESTSTTTTESTTTTTTEAITEATTTTTPATTTVTSLPATTNTDEDRQFQEDAQFLQNLLQGTDRNAKSLNAFSNNNKVPGDATTSASTTTRFAATTQLSEEAKLLQAILAANNPNTLSIPSIGGNTRIAPQTTTSRSIQDDIKQFEEDTKLLKALLAATGQNPNSLNIPSLDNMNFPTTASGTSSTIRQTTTLIPSTTARVQTTTPTIDDDLEQFSKDAKLLQALLQAAQNTQNSNVPIISGVTSNVRIASNPLTTSIGSNPTTPINIRPVYTSRTTTQPSPVFTSAPSILPVLTTLQPRQLTTVSEDERTTAFPTKGRRRLPTTTERTVPVTLTGRRAPAPRFLVTTEIPSTSTFSDEEDLLFLQNLKSVLNTNTENEDPETELANRIIALAVEKSLNEIQSGKQADEGRTGKNFATTVPYRIPTTTTTTPRPTTTTRSTTTTTPKPTTTTPRQTTTTPRPTTAITDNTPSIEDDIKQFQEDTKLLQALLKATGQDPSKFNIPTFPIANTNVKVSSAQGADLNVLANLLASPSPLNEPFDSLTQKPSAKPTVAKTTVSTTPKPFGAKIAVKDDLKNVQDDAKLLQTLIKLQGVQETTTQRSKLTITGQSTDEALQKLITQTKPTGMVSEATRTPMSISTEYGKSNDALLAALLKEQGFGPTTASSLDEQLRLAALLNQVVVTPKTRRTTTLPPPPPPPRRPVLDGLAWLWQQWRDTEPGPAAPRPNRRPSASPSPSIQSSSAATSNRVSWFGSGPFIGNADDRPTSNRIPLEPPRAVTAEQTPGRGQLVSAAINVTRAFSQFLGAAIQGAAQTVQSVIRAGQRATADAYSNGSG